MDEKKDLQTSIMLLINLKRLSFNYTYFYPDNYQRVWHGNVHDNVNMFGLE